MEAQPRRPERLVVAMSGGVDSSVAAAVLLEQGHQVHGVTLRLQACREAGGGCGADGAARARAVAGQLGIPHDVVDCAREFEAQVLRPAWEEYAAGRTPSPCLLCNERIKFGLLLAWARRLGAEGLATGHYARLAPGPGGGLALCRGRDPAKDQSYFLAGLDAGQLAAARFPLGALTKVEVRALARAAGLGSAERPESQDACLGGAGQSFAEALRLRFGADSRPGPILDDAGAALGRHAGVHRFTVGQRRGLAVPSASRCWVRAIRAEDAAVLVTRSEQALCRDRLGVRGLSWSGGDLGAEPLGCQVQVRYRHPAVQASVVRTGPATAVVTFVRPVRAIAPGQAAVFYDGERVLGRGWIDDRG